MQKQECFILVDDDELSGQLFSIIVRHVSREAKAIGFKNALEALNFLAHEYVCTEPPTMLFVDVNMPFFSGWEFLDLYDNLDAAIKNNIRIYMLSSSIDQQDRLRALSNKNVTNYFEKPLTTDLINSIRGHTIAS